MLEAWNGARIECNNMLHGRVHPSSAYVQEVLRRRQVSLSTDQVKCLKKINDSTRSHLSIQAFAGTGKTFLLSLMVEAALKAAEEWRGAVVIVTPSRRLRDAILQAPDFLGSIFQGTDYGPRASWLGRPSDGPGSFCSWEETVAGIVEEKLTDQRNNARKVEQDHLCTGIQEYREDEHRMGQASSSQ